MAWATKDRNNYNRYLIGNALVLLFSYCLARHFVVLVPPLPWPH